MLQVLPLDLPKPWLEMLGGFDLPDELALLNRMMRHCRAIRAEPAVAKHPAEPAAEEGQMTEPPVMEPLVAESPVGETPTRVPDLEPEIKRPVVDTPLQRSKYPVFIISKRKASAP